MAPEYARGAAPETAPVFIVGCPRSGTALLRNLLRSHPRLAFPGESHFIPGFWRTFGDPQSGEEARRLAGAILGLAWVRRWDLQVDSADLADCRTFAGLTSRIFEAYAGSQGKPRWGDKTPQYVLDIPLLVRLFPGCRVLHIVRDGRDVALSWLKVNFGPENVYTAAQTWKKFVGAGFEAALEVPANVLLEVRYEELLADTRETMRKVCTFIGEEFDPAVLTPSTLEYRFRQPLFGGGTPAYPSHDAVAQGNAGAWRRRMAAADRILFESIAGDTLTLLGYETAGVVRPVRRAERLFWKIHHAAGWTYRRLMSAEKLKWLYTDLALAVARRRGRFSIAPPVDLDTDLGKVRESEARGRSRAKL